jgi:FAD:protein FMN transferase
MEHGNPTMIKENFRAMGTEISVEIVLNEKLSEKAAEDAIGKVKIIFQKNEKIFSRFRADSELNMLNNNLGKEAGISKEMFEVLELCLKFNQISTGYFDPRVISNLERIGYDRDFKSNDLNRRGEEAINFEKIEGDLTDDILLNFEKKSVTLAKRIDTTGIAKGYTVDEATECLMWAGFENFIIDAGGDMFARGKNIEGGSWRIGIEGLADEKLMLKLEKEGIATSGIDRKRWQIGEKKFHHLINPKDPENFSFDIKTVTVIADKTVEADGRAKVLVLMGKAEGLNFANKNKTKALFLDYHGNVYISEAIKNNIYSNNL